MLKKYFALLLALLFCLTAAACAKNPEEPVKESSNNTESSSPSDTTPERVLVPDESELLPTYEGQNISVTFTDTFNSCTLMTVDNTTKEEYEEYVYQFDGFSNYEKIVAPRDVLGSTGNMASVYVKDTEEESYLINLLWIPAENSIYEVGQVKATIEPLNNVDLSVFEPATAAMGSIKPMLIQIGLDITDENGNDTDTTRSGMSYAYRLSDGSFFLLDGGGENSAGTKPYDMECAQRLYDTMKKYNAPENGGKGGEIVIAGWYISHPHTDHDGGFAAFVKKILNVPSNGVRLESVICNLPNLATQFDLGGTVEADPEEDTSSSAKLDALNDLLNQLRAQGVSVYKAHAGQMYYFDNMSFEILVTYDLLTPKLPAVFFSYGAYSDYKQNGQVTSTTTMGGLTNVLSIMARATVKVDEDTSYTMMWTGDSTAMNMAVANSMYGFAMKSDFLQVPHHGSPQYNNGTEGTTLIQNRYHMIQINHFIGACKEAPQYQYTAERFPEYYDSDGSYGFVRAKYILFPSSIDRTKYFDDISNENPDQPIDQLNTSNLTDWFAIYHLQDEARAAGGDCYLARCYLTVFTLGDDVTVAKDTSVITPGMPRF